MSLTSLLCAILLTVVSDTPDFNTQIIPLLTKSGCNAGACHGAAAGRGGFRLSLLGSDPAADYEAIVHEFEGRRVNLAAADKSLVLAKSTGYLDHGGEVIFDANSPEAARLRDWIAAGAPRGAPRKLVRLELTPRQIVVERNSEPIPLRATAYFDDGSSRDATNDVHFTSTDDAAVVIDKNVPSAKVLRSGQQMVIARYLDRVVPIEFLVPFSASLPAQAPSQAKHFIDDEIESVLATLRIPRSPAASDSVYLRRVYLDLTGQLPSVDQVEAFINDVAADKREKLVDELLASVQFTDYWTFRFARALRLHSLPNEKQGVSEYAYWLRKQIREGAPLNEMAATLLTAEGDSHEVGPANFARMVSDARAQAELVGKVFMGVRLGCANCHNHPLDRWTQDDFHGFAAVFAKLDRGQIVKQTPNGAVTNLRTGEWAVPRLPGYQFLEGEGDHRHTVAKWLTDSSDRQFARALVNRLWQAMMGRGLVEPIDDMRETNPPTHPKLLEKLAEDFASHGYHLRRTLRLIALSEAYARDAAALSENRFDDRFYSHALAKPLEAEVLSDAIAEVLEIDAKGTGFPAVNLIDPLAPAPSLDLLGRCNRVEGCEEGAPRSRGLAAELHLLNGDFLNERLGEPDNRLHRLLREKRSTVEVISQFYLAAFSRPPTSGELLNWMAKIETPDETLRRERLEDFVWSLLCSRAFMENH